MIMFSDRSITPPGERRGRNGGLASSQYGCFGSGPHESGPPSLARGSWVQEQRPLLLLEDVLKGRCHVRPQAWHCDKSQSELEISPCPQIDGSQIAGEEWLAKQPSNAPRQISLQERQSQSRSRWRRGPRISRLAQPAREQNVENKLLQSNSHELSFQFECRSQCMNT